jgi:predicted transcriptional regulator
MESEEYREESLPTNQNPSSESSLSEGNPVGLLRETIQRLEEIANRLEAESVENLPINSLSCFETLLNTTEELATRLGQPEQTAKKSLKTDRKTKSASLNWVDRLLVAMRSLLPNSLNNLLSDWALIGITSTIVVVLLVTSVILIPNRSPLNGEVSQLPPSTIKTPELESPNEPISEPTILPESKIPETIPPESTISEPEVEIAIPPNLVAPEQPQTVENLPPPKPVLTPEQSLIASIQEQISTITNRYSEDLISSIEANFPTSSLIVKIEDDWYQINSKQQDKIANEILANAKLLDFKKLQIIDNEGSLVARNPIVGKEVVILQRTKTIL